MTLKASPLHFSPSRITFILSRRMPLMSSRPCILAASQDWDRIELLQRRVTEYRPLNPWYSTAICLCVSIAGVAQLIRGYYSWSYEEAGILLNLAFWGGDGLVCFYLAPIVLLGLFRRLRYARDIKELKKANAVPQEIDLTLF